MSNPFFFILKSNMFENISYQQDDELRFFTFLFTFFFWNHEKKKTEDDHSSSENIDLLWLSRICLL